MSKTIVFFGNERLATGVATSAPILTALLKANYKVVAVVSNYSSAISRNSRQLEIRKITDSYKIPLLLPSNPVDIKQQLTNYRAEAAVLAAYGKIIPQEIINVFPGGIINIHPSLLPKHRGPIPVESVILGGETKTGVSIMQLAKQMDAGPVFGQTETKLNGRESKQQLVDNLLDVASTMLLEILPGILNGSIVALPQDETAATYDKLILKQDGIIDWQKSAQQIEREIRAYLGWPGSHTKIEDTDIIITKAHTGEQAGKPGQIATENKELTVFTGQGSIVIDSLKPTGKKEMSGAAFINGYL